MFFPGLLPCEYLYLCRHAACQNRHRDGESHLHASEWDLSEEGLRQAPLMGNWILQDTGGKKISRYLVGPFRRMVKTAKGMAIGNGRCWEIKNYLRARSRGQFDRHPQTPTHHPLYSTEDGASDGGETVSELRDRSQRLLDTIYRVGYQTRRAVVVTAREVIWAVQSNIEGWTDNDLLRLLDRRSRKVEDDILDGEIIQYSCWAPNSWVAPRARDNWLRDLARWTLSAVSPFIPNLRPSIEHRASSFAWRRRISPWDPSRCTEWTPVVRRRYSDDEL